MREGKLEEADGGEGTGQNGNETDGPHRTPAVARAGRPYLRIILYGFVLLIFLSGGILLGLYFSYAIDLPEVRSLEEYQPSVVTEIFGDDNRVIGQLFLERRKLVSPNEIPLFFKQAVISIEDKNYYRHFGVDFRQIFQSALVNAVHLEVRRGGSTITQQLSKLLFLTPEMSWERKIKEAILSIQIEKHYSKERIFTFYANKIYFGQGNYGIAAAAEYYFNKNVKDLTLAECALLAAAVKGPRYSPAVDPQKALQRRNIVLDEMLEDGVITRAQWKQARQESVVLAKGHMERASNAYFVEWVRQYLQKRYSNKQIFSQGLRVYTTIDPDLQAQAVISLQEGLRRFDKTRGWRGIIENVLEKGQANLRTYSHPSWKEPAKEGDIVTGLVMSATNAEAVIRVDDFQAVIGRKEVEWTRRVLLDRLFKPGDLALFRVKQIMARERKLDLALEQYPKVQGALLALENKTGAIKAMVGGYDWESSKFNRAVQARRQTGSIFKPFVYTTAILNGMSPEDTLQDEPLTIVLESGQEYTPDNYEKDFEGTVTLRRALAKSINIPAVRLGLQLGIPNVIQTARRFGITSDLYPYPSTALGACEITLQEMVSAFSTFPNDGFRNDPFFIQRIEDYQGNLLETHNQVMHEVLPKDTSRTMLSMLRGPVEFGTSVKAKELKADVAGKTGTTNDFTDAWFVGFNPSLTAGVWVGLDEKRSLGNGQDGSKVALPVWIDFMKVYLKNHPREFFPPDTLPAAAPENTGQKKPPDGKSRIIEEEIR